jgi:hypothetical protein
MSNKVEKKDRSQEVVRVASPGRVQQARKNGAIGAQTDSQGINNAAPKKHPPTKGY